MKRKDTIGEAAESMREPWEEFRLERSSTDLYPASTELWNSRAIAFVARLMPGQDNTTVIAVAKRLTGG